jgi:hypothetical protein
MVKMADIINGHAGGANLLKSISRNISKLSKDVKKVVLGAKKPKKPTKAKKPAKAKKAKK